MIAALAMLIAVAGDHPVTAELLAGAPRETVTFEAHGRTARCTGVPLRAVLTQLGLPEGSALRGAALSTVIVAEARDGYKVAFSLGELDPALGGKAVLLAEACDGKPLDATDGPFRLVVPGEARAARSVRQLVRLRVRAVD